MTKPSAATSARTKGAKSEEPGSPDIESPEESTFTPTSTSSGEPSRDSNGRWSKPKNVGEFASQANEVATMLLNGELDLDTARAYASIARVVAQTVSVEVTRSRFLKTEPNLSLEAYAREGE